MSSSTSSSDKKAVAPTGLVVIGAGLPRTGTNSLQTALEKLLGGPCYHMKTVLESGGTEHVQFWNKAIRQNAADEEFRHFLEDYVKCRSAVDYPPSFYWKKLIRIFPDAKVVLSVRNPESWRKSVTESIMYAMDSGNQWPMSWVQYLIGMGHKLQVPNEVCKAIPDGFDHSVYSACKRGDREAQEFFNKWKAEVIATVPPERLLVFEAKQGWEPLCKFLGVPVPSDGPYPRVNDTAEFRRNINFIRRFSYAITVAIPVLLALLLKWANIF